jgi:hypothetical protein
MRIYAQNLDNRFYRLEVSPRWADQHDNGALISVGLTVGKDLTERSLKALIRRGQATEVTFDEYNHSGCQSYCKMRGNDRCAW